jgi:dUTPase
LFKKVSSLASELLEVEDFYLDQTDRGERGFGSTGTN